MSITPKQLQASDERLWDLIRERMRDESNTEEIDRTIWHLFGERWAVMFTDLAGFSRRADTFGITHFLQVIYHHRELLFPIIRDFGGVLVKSEADSMLLLFRTPARAIDCAITMQEACKRANLRLIDEEKVHLCVGIGVGDILRIGDHDVWGREVNAASKLGEDTAKAGQILVTQAVLDELGNASPYSFRPLGEPVAGSASNFDLEY